MSFEFFKFSSLAIAANLARQGIPAYVFEFAYDLPGLGGRMRAVHTGDTPFLWRNYSQADLEQWPAFRGTDSEKLEHTAIAMGELYGSFLRSGDPGDQWPQYEETKQTILWFGEQVQPRDQLMTGEVKAFSQVGLKDVQTLEEVLVQNVRRLLSQGKKS